MLGQAESFFSDPTILGISFRKARSEKNHNFRTAKPIKQKGKDRYIITHAKLQICHVEMLPQSPFPLTYIHSIVDVGPRISVEDKRKTPELPQSLFVSMNAILLTFLKVFTEGGQFLIKSSENISHAFSFQMNDYLILYSY